MSEAQYNERISPILQKELSLKKEQVETVFALLEEGCTIPFIARYRKDKTGNMSDEVLRDFYERLTYLRNLEARKDSVIGSIADQEKLTPELEQAIRAAQTLVEVEDLYLPYKPKRSTRATKAKEKGLEPLALTIWEQEDATPLTELAQAYVNEEKGVKNIKEAVAGAMDIMAEMISDNAEFRKYIRELTAKNGLMVSKAKKPNETSVYELYYDYAEPLKKMAGHQILAINRGENEEFLTVGIQAPVENIIAYLQKQVIKNDIRRDVLETVIADAYKRLLAPSIETEIRNDLTEKAQDGAIKVFGKNLAQLLMVAPVAGKTVLGFDPAFRTGCKLAVLDPNGKVLDTGVIFPTSGEVRIPEAKRELKALITKYKIDVIALGNGTASRESEAFIAEVLHEMPQVKTVYTIVNEAGASVYSASKLGTEEFPDFGPEKRSAASLGRRLQDPLAELVKIDPKAIGVGQYQHDMDQKKLGEALSGVVEDCVNRVGVNVNTASPSLLEYISGISKPIAKNIVAYREENGSFRKREDLLKVPKLGPKAYEQCAGFLRIRGGKNPFDNTAVHPESYEAAQKLLSELGYTVEDVTAGRLTNLPIQVKTMDSQALADKIGVGVLTMYDIAGELAKPGRDPRDDAPKPILRTDVLSMEDLREGMILKGTVRNVIDFGCFVDIGVHQDGLVHISQLSNKFVKHPLDVVKVGDIVDVKVLGVDVAKKRISLTMKF